LIILTNKECVRDYVLVNLACTAQFHEIRKAHASAY